MPAVRIRDSNVSKQRKKILWEMLGDADIRPHRIHEANKAYFAIVNQEEIDQILRQDIRHKLKQKGFDVNEPLEYNANRTIIIKRLDNIIDEYTDDEIIQSLESQNSDLTVESLYRFKTTAKIIKVMLQSHARVQKALTEGIYLLHQRVKPNQIEKEIYIKLTPCTNCYRYEHTTNNCNENQLTLCAFCGQNDHKQKDCKSKDPNCLNCGEAHRTLAAACPLRKKLIKEKRTTIRDRSRSQSRARPNQQQQSYAEKTKAGISEATKIINTSSKSELKKLITKIMTSITYSHYMEAMYPGTFQRNMNEMYKKNGLDPVLFPDAIQTDGLLEIYQDITNNIVEVEIEEEEDEEGAEEMVSPTRQTKEQQSTPQSNQGLESSSKQETPIEPEATAKRLRSPSDTTTSKAEAKRSKDEMEPAVTKKDRTQSLIPKPQRAPPKQKSNLNKKMTTKDIEITVYVPPKDIYKRLLAKPLTESSKEQITRNLLQGNGKITWNNTDVKTEWLQDSLENGNINLEEVEFKIVSEKEYNQLEEHTMETRSRRSSLTT